MPAFQRQEVFPVHVRTQTLHQAQIYNRRTVHAHVPIWTPGLDAVSYQWFRGGKPIVGATGAKYTLRWVDFGRKITVQVTGAKAGYESVVTQSPARRVWF